MTADGALDRGDAAACLLLAAGTIAYVLFMPWVLGASDEGYYLYHAVRLLRGEVLYRDVSELITPLYIDGMALLFRIFGPRMATARVAAAVIQAGLVVLVYLCCRAVGVRRTLAGAMALLHPAIAMPVWPYATPHWLGTLLVLLLLLLALDRRRARRRGWLVMQGVLLGLVFLDRQPTGVTMAAALSALVVADALADRRWSARDGPSAIGRLAILAATASGVVLPLLGMHLAQAGIEPVFRQLVVHPLTGYREVNHAGWGTGYFALSARFTILPLLVYLPLVVLPVVAAQAIVAWVRGDDREWAEMLLVLLVFGVVSPLSILYFPDYIHIAFILPVALVLAAEIVQSLLRAIAPRAVWASGAIAAVLAAACGLQLHRNWTRAHADFPFSHDTAFGRVDLASEQEVAAVDRVRRVLDDTPGRELFVYPVGGWLYLLADANNPTRHDLIFPTYQSDEEQRGVIEALERRRPRYAFFLLRPPSVASDPIAAYIERQYRCEADGLCVRNDAEPKADR